MLSTLPIRRTPPAWARLSVPLVLVVTLSAGCGMTRSTLQLQNTKIPNPSIGKEVKIVAVTDRRDLQHELDRDVDEISDVSARAIGAYGRHLQLLPENVSVMSLVTDLVSSGFRQAGYRVATAGDPAFDQALPVSVNIEEFWANGYEGPWTFRLQFRGRLRIDAPEGMLRSSGVVVGGADIGTYYPPIAQMVGGGPRRVAWEQVVDEGCTKLSGELRAQLAGSR